jgi:hypothetical protein
MTMNRAHRLADVERFRCDADGELVSYLVTLDDPRLRDTPLLRRAATWWLDALGTKMRHCFVCGSWMPNRSYVGAVLLATAATETLTASASVCGCCRACWQDAEPAKIERAAAAALRPVAPGAQWEA